MIDEDILPDGMVDSMLYVDSLDDVPVPTPPTSGEGITDGTTSTDLTDVKVDDDTVISTSLDEVTETYYTDVDMEGFTPVSEYHYDENGWFVVDKS